MILPARISCQVFCVVPKISHFLQRFASTMNPKLEAIPLVEIDEGIFKYILIKVYGKDTASGAEISKNIVRGFARAQWHSDIYDEICTSVSPLGLDTECLGGGRIEHRPNDKFIKVYGYSQGFGKADHEESRRILLTKYGDYTIEYTDEGY